MQTVNKKYIKKDYLSQSSIPPSPASRGEGLLDAELMKNLIFVILLLRKMVFLLMMIYLMIECLSTLKKLQLSNKV